MAQNLICPHALQAPPFYFGSAQYISENNRIAHTQRLDNPYVFHFGPLSPAELPGVVPQLEGNGFLGSGFSPRELVSAVPAIELPSARPGSLAAFSGMRINPGWAPRTILPSGSGPWTSLNAPQFKLINYQSGLTGPGLGNSFAHPLIPLDEVYGFLDNSKSQDQNGGNNFVSLSYTERDSGAFCDYWDHVFLLNDALWDDWFVSGLADQSRGHVNSPPLDTQIRNLFENGQAPLANPRLLARSNDSSTDQVVARLEERNAFLEAAALLLIDAPFNVNSTSEDAWFAILSGIRERQVAVRNGQRPVSIDGANADQVRLSRLNTAVASQAMDSIEAGVTLDNDLRAWSGVRNLTDQQVRRLAQECVKQVKTRGPFLNMAEFINRRLSDDELGVTGALQAAIDYDAANPDPDSINYLFRQGPEDLITEAQLGPHQYAAPAAAVGSRFAGIPGYVTQSDLLKPLGNTLQVRDDTFRVRAYGESKDPKTGRLLARVWCEAIVQRVPDYVDPSDAPTEAAQQIDASGRIVPTGELSPVNARLGRRLEILQFRWLTPDEI